MASTRMVCDIIPVQLPLVVPGVVYVTAYTPGADASKSITPVDELSTSPEVELNAPPIVPVIIGVGSASTLQKLVVLYVNVGSSFVMVKFSEIVLSQPTELVKISK